MLESSPSLDASLWANTKVVVLSGGVGGARLVYGLAQLLPPENLQIIANTGDDFEHLTLWISPDCDTLMYTLAGMAPIDRGWGITDDTFSTLEAAKRLGANGWFLLGDQDMATHLLRTTALRHGDGLTEITQRFCRALGIGATILPMADSPHPTWILDTDQHRYSFQDWLVRAQGKPTVRAIEFGGAGVTTDAVDKALSEADIVLLPPSNPFVSLDPILRLGNIRERLRALPVVGVAPIIAGKAVKGPLAAMIPALLQRAPSAESLCAYYADVLDGYVVAHGDEFVSNTTAVRACDILMPNQAERVRLAGEVLHFAESFLRNSTRTPS